MNCDMKYQIHNRFLQNNAEKKEGRWEGREKDEKERCNKSNDGTRVIMRKVESKDDKR